MYLPIFSPTRILLRLKLQGIQVYKKEFFPSELENINCLEDVKKFISDNTKFKKEFDSYTIETVYEELSNPDGY